MRKTLAYLVAPFLASTGYRFTRQCRDGSALSCRVASACVDTVRANSLANVLAFGRMSARNSNGWRVLPEPMPRLDFRMMLREPADITGLPTLGMGV